MCIRDRNKGSLYLSCRHALRRKKQRLVAPTKWGKRKSISQRPICIDQQLREGALEMDTIVGPNNKGAILTITDRKTGYLIMEKLKHGKDAKQLARVVNRRLALLKRRGQIFSITTDNGTEFTPVSYTHLDVYKRQVGYFCCLDAGASESNSSQMVET